MAPPAWLRARGPSRANAASVLPGSRRSSAGRSSGGVRRRAGAGAGAGACAGAGPGAGLLRGAGDGGATAGEGTTGDAAAGVAAAVAEGLACGGAATLPAPIVNAMMVAPPPSTSMASSRPRSAETRRPRYELSTPRNGGPSGFLDASALGNTSTGSGSESTAPAATAASRSRACAADGRSSGSTLNKRMRTPPRHRLAGVVPAQPSRPCAAARTRFVQPERRLPFDRRVEGGAEREDVRRRARLPTCATSGARYAGVPAITPVRVSCTSSTARETPKSVSFTSPFAAISTLPGFTSRCTTPARWAAASPSAIWRPISATSAAGAARARERAASDSEGKYSMTSHGRPRGSPRRTC